MAETRDIRDTMHAFNVGIAIDYGLAAAILYRDIDYWCKENAAHNRHIHDGRPWSYRSIKAFQADFPYLSRYSIMDALKTLEESGLVRTGNFNPKGFDRTKWYSTWSEPSSAPYPISDDGGLDSDDGGLDSDDGGLDSDNGGLDSDDGGSISDDPLSEPGQPIPSISQTRTSATTPPVTLSRTKSRTTTRTSSSSSSQRQDDSCQDKASEEDNDYVGVEISDNPNPLRVYLFQRYNQWITEDVWQTVLRYQRYYGMDNDLVKFAFSQTEGRKLENPTKYVEKILKDYQLSGFKTAEQAERRERDDLRTQKRNNGKSIPREYSEPDFENYW